MEGSSPCGTSNSPALWLCPATLGWPPSTSGQVQSLPACAPSRPPHPASLPSSAAQLANSAPEFWCGFGGGLEWGVSVLREAEGAQCRGKDVQPHLPQAQKCPAPHGWPFWGGMRGQQGHPWPTSALSPGPRDRAGRGRVPCRCGSPTRKAPPPSLHHQEAISLLTQREKCVARQRHLSALWKSGGGTASC